MLLNDEMRFTTNNECQYYLCDTIMGIYYQS